MCEAIGVGCDDNAREYTEQPKCRPQRDNGNCAFPFGQGIDHAAEKNGFRQLNGRDDNAGRGQCDGQPFFRRQHGECALVDLRQRH